jgi:hypothetical protein
MAYRPGRTRSAILQGRNLLIVSLEGLCHRFLCSRYAQDVMLALVAVATWCSSFKEEKQWTLARPPTGSTTLRSQRPLLRGVTHPLWVSEHCNFEMISLRKQNIIQIHNRSTSVKHTIERETRNSFPSKFMHEHHRGARRETSRS